jgi:hypothetical protein
VTIFPPNPAVRESVRQAVDRYLADVPPPPPTPQITISSILADWAKILPPTGRPILTEVRLSQQAYDLLRLAIPTSDDRPVSSFDTMMGIPIIRSDLLPPGWWEMRDQHGAIMKAGILSTPESLISRVSASLR